MPRRHDPINDFFNELLDATVTTLIDTMRPEFRKLAKSAVEQAKAKADAKAEKTGTKTKSRRNQDEKWNKQFWDAQRQRVTPPQLTLYDVLEVSPRASHETIEAAYKSLARRHHPDVGGSLSLMQDITNAYGVLKDKVARHKYDRSIGL